MPTVFEGERNSKSHKHGKGTMVYADGCTYAGDWGFDKQEGEGVFDWGDGNKYIGQFRAGKQEGYGVYVWPTGGRYEGFWKNDRMNGYGKYRRNDGVMFIGFWRDDHQYGLGHRVQPERVCYGPNKVMERKKVVREIWSSTKDLIYTKDTQFYHPLEQHLEKKYHVDVTIVFNDNDFKALLRIAVVKPKAIRAARAETASQELVLAPSTSSWSHLATHKRMFSEMENANETEEQEHDSEETSPADKRRKLFK